MRDATISISRAPCRIEINKFLDTFMTSKDIDGLKGLVPVTHNDQDSASLVFRKVGQILQALFYGLICVGKGILEFFRDRIASLWGIHIALPVVECPRARRNPRSGGARGHGDAGDADGIPHNAVSGDHP